jgi:light-harvesting protein B-800-850 alpha chain
MWLVVKPSIGIPMGAVGILGISLFVHACILTNTTWFPAFLNGSAKPRSRPWNSRSNGSRSADDVSGPGSLRDPGLFR